MRTKVRSWLQLCTLYIQSRAEHGVIAKIHCPLSSAANDKKCWRLKCSPCISADVIEKYMNVLAFIISCPVTCKSDTYVMAFAACSAEDGLSPT
jgi:dimeric dUTPase (all-alpha-NTP-PPase superfamily)